jgi:EAL and modified HD-GYP domain-containing signal transduction protein
MVKSGIIARQPILSRSEKVYGYELLYRNSSTNTANVFDDNQATSSVLVAALTTFGLNKLIGDKKAFINVGKDLLLDPILEIIPKERFVLEILEDVEIDEAAKERIAYLHALGYTIAIDDLNTQDELIKNFEPILSMVHILKFDITQMTIESLKEKMAFFKHYKVQFLAEKVETQEEYHAYKALGFDYFQGYFFSKPDILKKEKLDPSRALILRITTLLNDENVSIKRIEAEFSNPSTLPSTS